MGNAKDPITAGRDDITAKVKDLRRLLTTKVRDKSIEQRLGDALARDIRGGPVAAHDGYKAGGGGPGQINGKSDPTGVAAEARVTIRDSGRGALIDLIHEKTSEGLAELDAALASVRHLVRVLLEIDDHTGIAREPERCELCESYLRGSGMTADEMFLFSDIGGRLTNAARVCQWHYDTIRRPPHRIPDRDKVTRRYRTAAEREKATDRKATA